MRLVAAKRQKGVSLAYPGITTNIRCSHKQ